MSLTRGAEAMVNGGSTRVLLLEDSAIDADLIVHHLRKLPGKLLIKRVARRGEYERAIAADRYNIVLSDYSLGDFDGLEALDIAKARAPLTPFIFISGVLGEQFATEALRAGATDYVTKRDIERVTAVVGRALKEADERRAHQRAVQALRESEARFRVTADSTPALIWSVGIDGRIDFANTRFESEHGLAREKLLDQGWLSIIAEEDQAEFARAFETAFTQRDAFRREVRVRDRLGLTRWLRCEANPRIDDSGNFLGYTGCGVDITDSKLAREQLEELVQRRTRELREKDEALRQSQKMELIGQLTGGIAHDFNNMLAGIMGSAELLKRRLRDGRYGECDRYIEALLASANRAASLTHRLLAFSRRQTLDISSIDTNATIRSLHDLLARTLGAEITLDLQLSPELWLAASDAHQLESALLNLAINARDAMPEGGRLTIATRNLPATEGVADGTGGEVGGHVELRVSDTGVGMTRETRERAFEPFYTTKPIGQGTGLGLSMIYGFVTQTGGTVRIESCPGEGTSVILQLPRGDHLDEGQKASVVRQVDPPTSRRTILIVEDEPIVRVLLVDYLQELGYDVIEASDAQSAMPVIESPRSVDLLLTDVGLPGVNGRQLADMARQHRPTLPILFATGYAQGADSKTGFLGPGMDMVGKPFALDVLGRKLGEILS
ncbi:hypothetical protein LMIY3S_00614 [Labrys miyagiensis]